MGICLCTETDTNWHTRSYTQ